MPKRTWTDEQLREAVATSRSLRGVMRALGYRDSAGRSGTRRILERIDALGLVTDFREAKSFTRPWTEDDLRGAVASSRSFHEVVANLGVSSRRGSEQKVYRQVRELGIDTAHFRRPRGKRCRWTDDELRAAVASTKSVAGTL